MSLSEGPAASLRAVIMHNCAASRSSECATGRNYVFLVGGGISRPRCFRVLPAQRYNALENSFEQISRTFENHVVDVAHWHKELLENVSRYVASAAAGTSDELRPLLNDLRGFRHLFRHAYDFQLDARRLEILLNDWRRFRATILQDLRTFASSLSQ